MSLVPLPRPRIASLVVGLTPMLVGCTEVDDASRVPTVEPPSEHVVPSKPAKPTSAPTPSFDPLETLRRYYGRPKLVVVSKAKRHGTAACDFLVVGLSLPAVSADGTRIAHFSSEGSENPDPLYEALKLQIFEAKSARWVAEVSSIELVDGEAFEDLEQERCAAVREVVDRNLPRINAVLDRESWRPLTPLDVSFARVARTAALSSVLPPPTRTLDSAVLEKRGEHFEIRSRAGTMLAYGWAEQWFEDDYDDYDDLCPMTTSLDRVWGDETTSMLLVAMKGERRESEGCGDQAIFSVAFVDRTQYRQLEHVLLRDALEQPPSCRPSMRIACRSPH